MIKDLEVTNRCKRLDPTDRVPDELSMDQDHSQEKEMQKGQMIA